MREAMCSIVFKTDKFMNLVCDHHLKTVLEDDYEVNDTISIDTPNELVNIEMKSIKTFMVTSIYPAEARDNAVTIIYKNNSRYTLFIPNELAEKLASLWKADHKGDYLKVVSDHDIIIIRIKDVIMVQFHKMRDNTEKPVVKKEPVTLKRRVTKPAVTIRATHQVNDSIPPTPVNKKNDKGSSIDERLFAAARMKVRK